MAYERPIYVVQSCNGERVEEVEVEFLGIEEDMQGRDRLTFRCPECHEEHTSYRLS